MKWDLNDTSTHYKLTIIENVTTALVFIIVVVTVLINRRFPTIIFSDVESVIMHIMWSAEQHIMTSF